MRGRIRLALLSITLIGCGDPGTTDRRGYTKNILEQPGLVVKGQEKTAIDALGDPVLPDTARILIADTARGG
jgi:hypothetical protein